MQDQYAEIANRIADPAINTGAQDVIDDLSALSANASQQLPQDSSHSLIKLNLSNQIKMNRITTNRIESNLPSRN